MTDDELKRAVQTIGMACFVKHFDLLTSLRSSTTDTLLKLEPEYKRGGAARRVSCAQNIVRARRLRDALKMIASAERIPPEVSKSARDILNNL